MSAASLLFAETQSGEVYGTDIERRDRRVAIEAHSGQRRNRVSAGEIMKRKSWSVIFRGHPIFLCYRKIHLYRTLPGSCLAFFQAALYGFITT